jgi:O-antigen/teichoic acid export membrane protein
MFLSQVSSAIIGSLGNFIASENPEKHIEIFKKIDFMYYIMYGFCFVCMVSLYNPFISMFFGANLIFKNSIVFVFCFNYLLEGFLQSFWNFRTTMGLFIQGKYRPVFAALINIVFSIILVQKIGVLGVLLGTTLSRVCVNLWYDPYIIFKHGLKHSPVKFFLMLLFKFASLFLISCIIWAIKHFLFNAQYTIFSFVILTLITVVVYLICVLLPLIKTDEFKYFFNIAKSFFGKFFKSKR